jgi:hypothetical protein
VFGGEEGPGISPNSINELLVYLKICRRNVISSFHDFSFEKGTHPNYSIFCFIGLPGSLREKGRLKNGQG